MAGLILAPAILAILFLFYKLMHWDDELEQTRQRHHRQWMELLEQQSRRRAASPSAAAARRGGRWGV